MLGTGLIGASGVLRHPLPEHLERLRVVMACACMVARLLCVVASDCMDERGGGRTGWRGHQAQAPQP
jgi:hypothetical protein